MALVMSAAGIHAAAETTPDETLTALLDSLATELAKTEMHFSVFYGVLDPTGRRLTYASAGHPHAFRIPRSEPPERLEATAPPLGLAAMGTIQRRQVAWTPGADLLALWTDGLVDARNDAGEAYGEQRLLDSLTAHRTESPESIVNATWQRPNPSVASRSTTAPCWSCGSEVPRAKRRLGQHFLTDPGILARIADALEARPDETILEIGPGPGGLTAALVGRAARVIAIEKDRDLIAPLRARFPSVELVEADALKVDWGSIAGGPYLVAGNIPYNITSPLLDKALTPPIPRRIVFLVQKEVADRVTAEPEHRRTEHSVSECRRWRRWSACLPFPPEPFSPDRKSIPQCSV